MGKFCKCLKEGNYINFDNIVVYQSSIISQILDFTHQNNQHDITVETSNLLTMNTNDVDIKCNTSIPEMEIVHLESHHCNHLICP